VSGGRSSKRRLETQALGNINNGARVTLSKDIDAQRKFLRFHHHETIQMTTLVNLINVIGGASNDALQYLEQHHWLFGFLIFAYLFRLHDRSVHARFSALDKRVDEIRKRLACGL
jgi:hypothetical protein